MGVVELGLGYPKGLNLKLRIQVNLIFFVAQSQKL